MSTSLPLVAPDGCSLSPTGVASQQARASLVRLAVQRVQRFDGELRVELAADVDRAVLAELIAVESACCPFLTIGLDEAERILTVATDDARGAATLDAIESMLR